MEDEPLERICERQKWENDDYIYKCHILNGMVDSLFDVDQYVSTAKRTLGEIGR